MRLYVDTAFNGHGGDLISLAIVSEDGREFYQVMPLPKSVDAWVAANVIPVLDKKPLWDVTHMRSRLQEFLEQFEGINLYADWHDDFSHFFEALGGKDYETSMHVVMSAHLIRTPPGQPVSSKPHNALADARALRDWHTSQAA